MLVRKLFHSAGALVLVCSMFVSQHAVFFGLGAVTAVTVTQTACPGADSIADTAAKIAKYADRAIVVARNNGQSTTRLEQLASLAREVETAFRGGDVSNGVELFARLIDVFNLVTNDAQVISDPKIRTVVMVALWILKDYLDELASKLETEAAKAPSRRAAGLNKASVNKISAFRQKRQWRCRNSVNGQFATAEFCKKNPATSQVEAY